MIKKQYEEWYGRTITKTKNFVSDENIINELAYLGTNNEEDLKTAGDILKELFIGKPLSLIKDREFREKVVTKELKKYKEVFDKVLDAIMSSNHISDDITIAGKEKLIEYQKELQKIQEQEQ